jgi:hypothetical protein
VLATGALVVLAYQVNVHDPIAAGVPLAWPALHPLAFGTTVLAALPAIATPAVPQGGGRGGRR